MVECFMWFSMEFHTRNIGIWWSLFTHEVNLLPSTFPINKFLLLLLRSFFSSPTNLSFDSTHEIQLYFTGRLEVKCSS